MTFSESIVYVDESGDHALSAVDPQYPVFVLAFCVFDKTTYTESCAPALQRLKFKHWGHDMVVLHEREIRKATGQFSFLVDAARRLEFMIADLIARPIGRSVLDAEQMNRAFEVIEPKLYRYRGRVAGAGLKIFP